MAQAQQSLARRMAHRIGRVGVWTNQPDRLPSREAHEFLARIEALGYAALWFPEGVGSKEALSHAALLLAATQRITVASGIASIWARDAQAMANASRGLWEAYPERFLLGMGVSHAPSVAARGTTYQQPFERMRDYLETMDETPYNGPEPHGRYPRVLAALGPRMLRLSAEHADGAHPYFVPVAHTHEARGVLGKDPLLAVEQTIVLESHAGRAREIARAWMRRYLALPNYRNNLLRLGYEDAALENGGSDQVVDDIVAWGEAATIAARVQAHLQAGADHVCVQALEGSQSPLAQLEQLAPELVRLRGDAAP